MKPLSSLKLMPSSVLVLLQSGLASKSRPTESNVFVSRTDKEQNTRTIGSESPGTDMGSV